MSRITERSVSLGSLLGERRSHPNKLLIDHLQNAARLAEELADRQALAINREVLSAIMLTHDLGKAHPVFQKYLAGMGSGIKHSRPSAWFTYSLTRDIWAAELVCRHHTCLRNTIDMIGDWYSKAFPPKEMDGLLPDWPYILEEKDRISLNSYLYGKLIHNIGIDRWLLVRAMFSLLITADRMEAIGITGLPERDLPVLSPPVLPKRTPEIDAWRENIKKECVERSRTIDGPGVYTLTLPTGAGKTLTGLTIAHEWAKRFGCRSIIYGLPFISIVEQTASVAKCVFGDMAVQEDHSLAYGKEAKGNENEKETTAWDRMAALFRYWREPVVLTTLVHLWDAVFNPHANQTMNFHRLSKAVVIFDEPQTISPRYWQGLGDILALLSEKWGTFFLLMTATQPHIKASAELAPPDTFFPYPRHQYTFLNRKVKLAELSEELNTYLPVYNGSGLVVVNRKRAAIEVYSVLERMDLGAPLLLLSSWVTPWRRRIILRYLKWLEKKGRRRYLVSTQVVEAGVDLDFEWAFRDLGPLDSIIQIAGRCNRHSRTDFTGEVLVAELIDEKENPLWRWVYNEILIDSARKVLVKNLSFSEDKVPAIVDAYYKSILEGLETEPIYDHLAEGRWGEYPKLIDEKNRETVTIFVEENKNVWPLLEKLQETHWTLDNREEQKRLLQRARQYAIEIPASMIADCKRYCAGLYSPDGLPIFRPVFCGDAWFLGKAAIGEETGLYSKRLGFIPPGDDWDNTL